MDRAERVDLLIVGGTPAGCCAAIAAARRGKSVLILEPTQQLGGMNSNGVGVADTGSRAALGGIYGEFCANVTRYYGKLDGADQPFSVRTVYWEPHIGARIWREMVTSLPNVKVIFGAVATGVEMDGKRIDAVIWEEAEDVMGNLPSTPGEQHRAYGRIVLDCTYEGDIAAWAGAPWRIGREARSDAEPHAGIIYMTYMVREPSYGYLPQSILPGSTGEASDLVMAATYRLACKRYADTSPTAAHRVSPPPGYDPANYEWWFNIRRPGRNPSSPYPGGKFDLNVDHYGNDRISTDIVLAHPRERKKMRQEFINYAIGFLYELQNKDGQPEVGLADDEYVDNNNMPYMVYVREGRRIYGLKTLTEENTNPHLKGTGYRPPHLSDSIAIGDFEMDSKIVQRAPSPDLPPEGTFFLRGVRVPFQVPYGCIVPLEVEQFLVPVALSATHVAQSVARMEPVWGSTGHAAGLAAVLMLDLGCSAADVPIERLQEMLIADGGKPVYFSDVDEHHPYFRQIQWAALRGAIPHDRALRFRPDDPIQWAELAELVVKAMQLPISVTSPHYADVPVEHPAFRYVETLYDLSTRSGVDVLPGVSNPRYDSFVELHRVDNRAPWLLEFNPDRLVSEGEVIQLVSALAHVLGRTFTGEQPAPEKARQWATRGWCCSLLAAL